MSESVKSWTASAPKRERFVSTWWLPRPGVEASHNSRQQITITLSRLASLAVAERGHFHFRRVHWGRLWNIGTIIMTNETARHVNETESDRRGIKDGVCNKPDRQDLYRPIFESRGLPSAHQAGASLY
jgi:hypothetical protein